MGLVAAYRGGVPLSREAFDPAADEFSSCGEGDRCDKAAVLRRILGSQARVVHRHVLEWVWELQRPSGAP